MNKLFLLFYYEFTYLYNNQKNYKITFLTLLF